MKNLENKIEKMNKKEKTIQAFKDIANRYRNPQGKKFFSRETCELCNIHFSEVSDPSFNNDRRPYSNINCWGCPLASKSGGCGCKEYQSYKDAFYEYEYEVNQGGKIIKSSESFIKRAEFFESKIEYLHGLPEFHFTKEGENYFRL